MVRALTNLERSLLTALRPFADFYVRGAPDEHIITSGSSIARRQLRMGDCRAAYEPLARIDNGRLT